MNTGAADRHDHDELALCVMQACDCDGVIDRYRAYRSAQGDQAADDGVRALLRTFEEAGSCDEWAGKVGHYRRRYNPTAAPVPAAEVERTAELLYAHGIETVADLRRALADSTVRDALANGVRAIGGDREWAFLLDVAGYSLAVA